MKKIMYLLLLMTTVFLTECKKQSDNEVNPEPGGQNTDGPPDFIKFLSVAGSESITFDSAANSYMVVLPSSYANDIVKVDLSVATGMHLVDSLGNITADSQFNYTFRGEAPLRFNITDDKAQQWSYVSVYFNFPDAPKIELLSKEIPIRAGTIPLPIKFISGIGTIPSAPLQWPVVKVIDRKTNMSIEANLSESLTDVFLEGAEKLINAEQLALEFHFKDRSPVVFEGVRFTRGIPQIAVPLVKFLYARNDTITGYGGYFVPQEKYTVKFSNDYISTSISANLRFVDVSKLTAEGLPGDIPEGSYLLTFYEKDKVIGKSTVYMAETETQCIETMWKGSTNQALDRNAERLKLGKGESFYVKPSPPEYGYSHTSFNVRKLPRIRLRLNGQVKDLDPELTVINWAVAGVSFAIGKYVLPTGTPSGQYEVTAVFENNQESKPYWSKLEVQ